jgi:DNA-binding NarL/FixJ family response regulator
MAGLNVALSVRYPYGLDTPMTGTGTAQSAQGTVEQAIDAVLGDVVARPLVLESRERALVSLLVEGHTDTSAARRLQVSPRTVTNMLRTLMDQLGVKNRFQLGIALGLRTTAQSWPGES